MKIITLLIFLLGFCIQNSAQTPYLNERYARNQTVINTALAISDSSYYIANELNINTKIYHYSRINFQGNTIDTLDLVFNDTINRIENCVECLRVHKGRLYNMYNNFPNNSARDTGTIVLSKIHLDLRDTIKTKAIALIGYKGVGVEASYFDSDSTFLISGYASRDVGPNLNYEYDLLLAKFDTNFNLIWVTTVDENTPDNIPLGPVGGGIILDDFGGILVSGNPFVEPAEKRAIAARFNAKTGALLWYKEFKGDYGIGGMYCAKRDDGNYQFIQNWYLRQNSSAIRFNIGVMDTLGNIINQKLIGDNNRFQFCLGLIHTLDGNYYTAGTDRTGNAFGFGLKFNPKLDSLWQGYYWHDDPWEFGYFSSFRQKPDSSIIHVGSHIDHINPNPSPARLYSWLLETDQNGCDTSGCNLSIQDYVLEKRLHISIFPNPNRGSFQVQFQGQQSPAFYQFQISDMFGRKVSEESYWMENNTIEINTDLPKGIYLLAIFKEGQLLGNEKVVLE